MAADTFSNTLGVLLMGTGNDNNSWGNNANLSVFQIFEDAIANALTSGVSGGTLDFSGTPPPNGPSQVRYAALIFTGVLTSAQVIQVPNLTKWWWVNNQTSGAFTLRFQTSAAILSTAIPQNSGWQLVQCDGNNNIIVSPFNSQQIRMPDGSVSAPAYSDINETNSGWYRAGTQDWRLAINGADVVQATGAGAANPNTFNTFGLSTNSVPAGAVLPFAGPTLPSGFIFPVGGTVSRSGFPTLLAALRISFTAQFTLGSPTLSNTSINLLGLGLENATIESPVAGISGLFVAGVASSSSITMSGNATASSGGSVQCFIYPNGNGDGSTTFGIPDYRGRGLFGRDNMGSTSTAGAGRITTTTSISGFSLSQTASGTPGTGGSQTVTLIQVNLPAVNFTVSATALTAGLGVSGAVNIPGGQGNHNHSYQTIAGGGGIGNTGGLGLGNTNTGAQTLPAMSGSFNGSVGANAGITGVAISGGASTPVNKMPPTAICNFILKT